MKQETTIYRGKEYNGYANYQTWNVCLYLANDYETYKKIRAEIEKGEIFTEQSARPFCVLLLGNRTADDVALSHPWIDWSEVADCLNSME